MPLNLDHLEQLTAEWKSLQPLQPAYEERLWQKLRLEWNFHSNHIEGNTLTYGETAALLLHDQTSGTHTTREYDEMKGHDLAIELVRRLAREPQALTEAAVRELNQILLKEPFYKDARTLDDKPTRKQIIPGQYKQSPNSVKTVTGAIFHYAEPMDVSPKMASLIQDIKNADAKDGLDFLAALALIHHKFTLIHPFDDGNGRVARLLTNYTLLRKDFLPLVIPANEKEEYLAALRLADGGEPETLTEFFFQKLIWSLKLGIKAARGESLEEPSDIEKEIALFVREQKSQKREILKKSSQVIRDFLKIYGESLFEKFDVKTKEIGEVFESRKLSFTSDVISGGSWQEGLITVDVHIVNTQSPPNLIGLALSLRGYLGRSIHPFGLDYSLLFRFEEYEYRVEINGQQIHHAVYAEGLTSEKADEIIGDFLKRLLLQIKKMSQQ